MKEDTFLKIGGKKFSSRLMVGTGIYTSSEVMIESLSNTESEIVTVAVRRAVSYTHLTLPTILRV